MIRKRTTNVRPGDLAVVVRSLMSQNIGAIVRVLHAAEMKNGFAYGGDRPSTHFAVVGVMWIVESMGRAFVTNHGAHTMVCPVPDPYLRPIRDAEGEDEMITIAGTAPTWYWRYGRIKDWEELA